MGGFGESPPPKFEGEHGHSGSSAHPGAAEKKADGPGKRKPRPGSDFDSLGIGAAPAAPVPGIVRNQACRGGGRPQGPWRQQPRRRLRRSTGHGLPEQPKSAEGKASGRSTI